MKSKSTLPAACTALAQLGDAVALIDRQAGLVCWTSPSWQALSHPLATAGSLSELNHLLGALGADLPEGQTSTRRLFLGDSQQWQVELAPLDEVYWLLRLTDRHQQSRELQRQLDDREQLLFTSRTLSVGEMATTLAHELNQPIGATANLLRGLRARLSRRKPALDEETSGALDRAIDQVMFAARVITRIREFTQSNRPKLTRVDVGNLLRESATLLDWDARRAGARITLLIPDAPMHVRGDRVMLQQVLVNLIRNALDALRGDPPADPQLRLSVEHERQDVVVRIRDNGCGLDTDAEARLFVPFASNKPTGMGIGLSICRSFIELHQGRLWFTRNPEGGATFHVGMPLCVAQGTPGSDHSAQPLAVGCPS